MNTRRIEAPGFDDIVEGMVISEKRILETTPDSITLTIHNPKTVIAGFEDANKLIIRAYNAKVEVAPGVSTNFDYDVIAVKTSNIGRSLDVRMLYKDQNIHSIHFILTGNAKAVSYQIDPKTQELFRKDDKPMSSHEANFALAIIPSVMEVIKHYTS